MHPTDKPIFLIDVDNTLLDNDAVIDDIGNEIERLCGKDQRQHYWALSEALRNEVGYVDYLGAVQRLRDSTDLDPHLYALSAFLLDYPFAQRLFPRALEVLHHLRQCGQTVIVSDGDIVFQPRKIHRSGIGEAVEEQVLIYRHKELMLDDIARRYPAQHYVMIDDKLSILTAMKKIWGERLTTVFVRQGHYALDPAIVRANPAADMSIARIGDLLTVNFAR